MRVLVVEDEMKVANALREGLEGEKFEVVVERTGEGAFFRVNTESFEERTAPKISEWRSFLDERRGSRVVLWGSGSKAVSFVSAADPWGLTPAAVRRATP